MRLSYVCDLDSQRLADVSVGDVRLTTDPEAVLTASDVSAVLLSTPAEAHARLAVAALSAGKHVFVEKPMALNLLDAERIDRAASASGRVLMVGHILHYDPAYATLARLVDESMLGRVRRVYAVRHAENARGGSGAWWALAPHDVSWITRVLREAPGSVHATRYMATDRTQATLGFNGGAEALLDVCGAAAGPVRHLTVIGEHCVAFLDATHRESTLSVLAGSLAREIGARLDDGARRCALAEASLGTALLVAGEPLWPLTWTEPLCAEMEAFVGAVLDGSPFPATAEDGLEVTRVLTQVDAAISRSTGVLPPRRTDLEQAGIAAVSGALIVP